MMVVKKGEHEREKHKNRARFSTCTKWKTKSSRLPYILTGNTAMECVL